MPFNQSGNENLGKALLFLKEFDAENLDEKICELKALQICCRLGFTICKHCNHHQMLKGELQRMYRCDVCRKEIWITGGSFFDHVRKFRPYLASFFLLERGIILSASDLSNVLGISVDMAGKIYKRIAKLVSEKMQGLGSDISTTELSKIVCRRTIETPARQSPLAEEVEIQKRLALCEPEGSIEELKEPELTTNEVAVLALLSELPTTFAAICERVRLECADASAAVMGLELWELAVRLPGDRYILSDRKTKEASKAIDSKSQKSKQSKAVLGMIDFVEERFQGIGRKNHQLYAALYWIFVDRKRWGPGSILQLCAQSRHIPYREILEYVSPPTIKILTRA
ncbi:MAG: hypothetical protein C0469_11560 [Cyanobacteria bacterium DS2.3.42]|nr:hypothetical protein [Cyanobacteria bacterium DS2.3.42]